MSLSKADRAWTLIKKIEKRNNDGVVHLGHDGRLPLQVLGDVGVVDRVKRHHLWSHLLVQNDFVRQQHVSKWAKGDWGQLVVAD